MAQTGGCDDVRSGRTGCRVLTDAPVFVDAHDEPRYDEDIFHLFNATAAGSLLLVPSNSTGTVEGRCPI